LFFIKPVFSKKASSPTKMAEILGMGIPVICNSNVGDVDRIVTNNDAGILISDLNHESYQKAIANIDSLLKTDYEHYRKISIDHFSLTKGANDYLSVYQRLLKLAE
jgi:glycosyltransferase involved in cell wall biosynthesis